MTLDPTELFRCVPLQCKLTRDRCGERYVRAEALQKDGAGGWIPQRWASFAAPCRGCKIGAAHADLCGVERPNVPTLPERSETIQKISKPKYCDQCNAQFVPTSNRQRKCPNCSESRRFKKLRESAITVCFVCNKPYRPSSQELKPMICPACVKAGTKLSGSGENER